MARPIKPATITPTLQLFPDIADPVQLDVYYPMYALDAIDMPAVGTDFVDEAARRSGHTPHKRNPLLSTNRKFLEYLSVLHRAALYKHPFQIPIKIKHQTQVKTAQFVPGGLWNATAEGPCPAEIMVIGKHPGWDESVNCTNFSGQTSEILKRALHEAGVTSDEYDRWYMTNVVKFPHLDPSSSVLPAVWVKDCLPLLHQELRIVAPKYILLLGDDAVKALLGRSKNLTNTAGQIIELTIPRHEYKNETPMFHTIKVMTCSHPARIARQTDLYPTFLSTINLFVKLIHGEQICTEEKDLEFYELTNESQLQAWADLILAKNARTFALDCEWHGDYPTNRNAFLRTIQLSWGPKQAACIVLRNAAGDLFKGDWLPHLKRILKERKVRLIGHNFKADLPWLFHSGLDLREEFEAPIDDTNPDGVSALYGWQKTATEGGFDTMFAVHAWQETYPLGLEACTSQLLGMPRYDLLLEAWKTNFCKEQKISKSELEGYGDIPDSILHPYACLDAIGTFRLHEYLNKPDGPLDKDKFGNSCRKPFWISMRASPAFLEMEMTGVYIDRTRAEDLTGLYQLARNEKLKHLRELISWPKFNPNSSKHKIEFLFGTKYLTNNKGQRPEGAKSLNLTPIKSTGKRTVLWKDVMSKVQLGQAVITDYSPSTDKESLGILSSVPKADEEIIVLRDLNFLNQILRTVLRAPTIVPPMLRLQEDDPLDAIDESGDHIYDKGILSFVDDDARVRSNFFATAETGRAKSSKPNLQNFSKAREADYQRILGSDYTYSLRSIVAATPGNILIEADYSAAEVAGLAWLCQDPALISHVERSTLPESHPDYFDIHANVAVRAFKLNCASTKDGLESIGMKHLRIAAKRTFFGHVYGQGAEAAARNARQEGIDVSKSDIVALLDSLASTYPIMEDYFQSCYVHVEQVGHLCNCFGRRRRFQETDDFNVMNENKRQGANFTIQSLVADAMSTALDKLYTYRKANNYQFKILLQIHDAVVLECPISQVEFVYDTVIPHCMSDLVDIWPTDLYGERLPGITKPYHLQCGRDVYLNWGEDIPLIANKILKIPSRFCSNKASEQSFYALTSQIGWREYIRG